MMDEQSVVLDLMNKIKNVVDDARAEYAGFTGDIVLSYDESGQTLMIKVKPKETPKQKPTKE